VRCRAILLAVPFALATLAPAAAADPVTDAVSEAVGAAQGAVILARDAANGALSTAASAPQPLVATAWHYYDNAERVPRTVGEFVMERDTRLADLDGPILQDLGATVAPHLAALGGAVRVDLELHVPLGGPPSGGVTPTVHYSAGDAAAAGLDLESWAERSAATAQAWTAQEAASAQAFPPELVGVLMG
jgi:hypothetical protein